MELFFVLNVIFLKEEKSYIGMYKIEMNLFV